jgi:N-acetylneuraminate synthase
MPEIVIGDHIVGPGHPTYVIAELSANHGGHYRRAVELLHRAAEAGADAVKVQTYRPETMTIDSSGDQFQVAGGTLWDGTTLFELYRDAQTPWEWLPGLQKEAKAAAVDFFSSPFDVEAVTVLAQLDVPVLKIASFELVDHALITAATATGKPVIMSTGMASAEEIDEAVLTARAAGGGGIALLRCNSAYPAPVEEMDLRTMVDMATRWTVPVGLSDHTLGATAAVTAVAMGASLIEKHFTLSRDEATADAAFSLEPYEFKAMVIAVREAEAAMGTVRYGPSEGEKTSLAFRRSLFVVEDVAQGEAFTQRSVRSIRPGYGLPPKHLGEILGRRARRRIERGTPLSWELVDRSQHR